MKAYLLTLPANEDLLRIFEYTLEKWGEEQVHVYVGQLEDAFNRLAANPQIIGSRPADHLTNGCRIFKVAHHMIVYRSEAEFLLIGRILHESMDFTRHVGGRTFD